ncbi:hypothetical protein JZ751_026230 [Albula glossodonta]|uniref:Uncharacterized protein n=1 Tax=Albula glossodonta TaxID=121402 RepID=A0A8T2PLA6_9TELE|nr:hypothetical protein JZ751_026230 [Albula glossodonta]
MGVKKAWRGRGIEAETQQTAYETHRTVTCQRLSRSQSQVPGIALASPLKLKYEHFIFPTHSTVHINRISDNVNSNSSALPVPVIHALQRRRSFSHNAREGKC